MTDIEDLVINRTRILTDMMLACFTALIVQLLYLQVTPWLILIDTIPAVFIFAGELIESRVKNFFAFSGSFAAMLVLTAALIFTQPGSSIVMIINVCAVVFFFYSRVSGKSVFYPGGALLLYPVFAYILGLATESASIRNVAVFCELLSIILIIIYYNELNLKTELMAIKDRSAVPYERIRKTSATVLGVTISAVVAVTALTALFVHGRAVIDAIRTFLVMLIQKFFEWLKSITGDPADEYSSTGQGALPDLSDIIGQNEDDPFMEKFWDIVTAVVFVLVAILAVFLIIKIVRAFYKNFMMGNAGAQTDKIEYLDPHDIKADDTNDKSRRRAGLFPDMSPAARIRRSYVKWIKSGAGAPCVCATQTPSEIEVTAFSRNSGAFLVHNSDKISSHAVNFAFDDSVSAEIHDLYELARYHSADCTPADAKKMQELIRNSR